jgi:hypothetical protein
MIFLENRFPLFRIMLYLLFEHDLFGKPVPTFPDPALTIMRAFDAIAGNRVPLFEGFRRGCRRQGSTRRRIPGGIPALISFRRSCGIIGCG